MDVRSQLAQNDFRVSMVKSLGAALTALVALGQLSSEDRFSRSGPTWLAPASFTALIITGATFGFFYGNTTYVSTVLRNRLNDRNLQATDTKFPDLVIKPMAAARLQFMTGIIGMVVTVGFFIAFLWT